MTIKEKRFRQPRQFGLNTETHLRAQEGAVEVKKDFLNTIEGTKEAQLGVDEVEDEIDGVLRVERRTDRLKMLPHFSVGFDELWKRKA